MPEATIAEPHILKRKQTQHNVAQKIQGLLTIIDDIWKVTV